MNVEPFLHGLGLNLGLTIALGPQNIFVLRKSLQKDHVMLTVLASTVCNAILACVAVFLVGEMAGAHPIISLILKWSGSLFLLWYSYRSCKNALNGRAQTLRSSQLNSGVATSWRGTLFAAIGFSLLNPHAYLDYFLIVGGAATVYQIAGKVTFFVGVSFASLIWFISIALLSVGFASLFQNRRPNQIIDFVAGALMFLFAVLLISS